MWGHMSPCDHPVQSYTGCMFINKVYQPLCFVVFCLHLYCYYHHPLLQLHFISHFHFPSWSHNSHNSWPQVTCCVTCHVTVTHHITCHALYVTCHTITWPSCDHSVDQSGDNQQTSLIVTCYLPQHSMDFYRRLSNPYVQLCINTPRNALKNLSSFSCEYISVPWLTDPPESSFLSSAPVCALIAYLALVVVKILSDSAVAVMDYHVHLLTIYQLSQKGYNTRVPGIEGAHYIWSCLG